MHLKVECHPPKNDKKKKKKKKIGQLLRRRKTDVQGRRKSSCSFHQHHLVSQNSDLRGQKKQLNV